MSQSHAITLHTAKIKFAGMGHVSTLHLIQDGDVTATVAGPMVDQSINPGIITRLVRTWDGNSQIPMRRATVPQAATPWTRVVRMQLGVRLTANLMCAIARMVGLMVGKEVSATLGLVVVLKLA